jgi:AraC-like DNA-binding protein
MGDRTMQRQLKENGFTFKELVKDVRFELSKLYLKNKQFHLTEIAFQLEFSESNSFSRAFKRWSGHSPMDYH